MLNWLYEIQFAELCQGIECYTAQASTSAVVQAHNRQRCSGSFENIPKPFFASHTTQTQANTHRLEHIRRTHTSPSSSHRHPTGGQRYHHTIIFFDLLHFYDVPLSLFGGRYIRRPEMDQPMRYDRFCRQDLNAAALAIRTEPNSTTFEKNKFSVVVRPNANNRPWTSWMEMVFGLASALFHSAMRDI